MRMLLSSPGGPPSLFAEHFVAEGRRSGRLNPDEPDVAGQMAGVASGRKLGIVSDEFLVVSATQPNSDADAVEALPVLDMAAVDELASALPAKRFVPFLRSCLLRADEQTAALARLDPKSALAEIQNEAHNLLANAGTFGARQVQELCGLATRLQNA
jgi:hypothetical protein